VFAGGRRKPAFRAFQFPFVATRHGKGVKAWGKAPDGGKLRIEKSRGGGWRTVKKLSVHRGEVFTAKLGRHARGRLRAQVGGVTSLPWH
jgi:hypothetical protein